MSEKEPRILKRLVLRWLRHGHSDRAAAISFYALLSAVPLLLLGVYVAALMLGESLAQGKLHSTLKELFNEEIASFLEGMIHAMQGHLTQGGVMSTALASLGAMWAASSVLERLREGLDVINGRGEVAEEHGFGKLVGRFALGRLLCSGVVLLMGLALTVSSMMDGVVKLVGSWDVSQWEVVSWLVRNSNVVVWYKLGSMFLLLWVVFALFLKVLPSRRPRLRSCLCGAGLGAVLVGSMKGGLEWYLKMGLWASASGSALALLLVFFWLFFSVQAFLLGAEVTCLLDERRRRREGSEEK